MITKTHRGHNGLDRFLFEYEDNRDGRLYEWLMTNLTTGARTAGNENGKTSVCRFLENEGIDPPRL